MLTNDKYLKIMALHIYGIGGSHLRGVYGYELANSLTGTMSRSKMIKIMRQGLKDGIIVKTEINPLYMDRFKLTDYGYRFAGVI